MSPAVHLGLPAPRASLGGGGRASARLREVPAAPWSTLASDAPELAAAVAGRFAASERHVLATMTVSGAPRVSGSAVQIRHGELLVPVVLRSPKGADLAGDPRCVIHSNPGDGSMVGDVKITGRVTGLVGADGELRPHGRDAVDVLVLLESLQLSVRDQETGEITVTRWVAPEVPPLDGPAVQAAAPADAAEDLR